MSGKQKVPRASVRLGAMALAALAGRDKGTKAMTDTPRCNHWPGQPRCEVCGITLAAPAEGLRAALEAIRDKMQAVAYHRNYRQACIDANEIALDALAALEADR